MLSKNHKHALKPIIAFICLLIASFSSHAQKFEWINFFQGQNIQAPVSLSVDSSGNQYASFYFKTEIKFKSITITKNNNQSGLVLKQDTEGKVLWYKVMEGIREDLYTLDSKFNSKGNLIVLVTAAGPSILVGSDTLKRNGSGTDFAFYLLEFNDTGKLINGNHLIDGSFYGFNVGRILASDKNDNLYLVNAYAGQVKVYDSTGTVNLGSSTSGARNIIFKFSRSGKKLEWTSTLPYSGLSVYNIKVDIHENVYAATYWTASSSTSFTFNGQTMRNPQTATGAVFVWDKQGNDKSFFCIKASDKNSVIYDLAVYDSNSVFISGAYQGDSALFDKVWEKNNKLGGYLFYARYDINGNLKWLNVEDTSYTTIIYPNKYYCGMTNYKDAFFYLSYFMPYHYSEPVIFDGQKYEAKPNGYGLNLKVDDKGNILWGYRTLYPFSAMGTDANDNLYFQGRWDGDTIKFNNIKAFPTGTDGFLGKTTDYSINRGNVYAGPYCAGDTIKVPFTKKGDFDTSNFFIAELSDEFGIFDGRERELGRVKATKDSVVIGTLPLFKTASSGNYRIRIISTNPIVQSYYRFDKLRLLIYSRDKADPGPTETICNGDSIKLSTYGGTKWTWSPKYNMSDSNARQPIVWPLKDTTYKIIIADSSGCGEPDTAFKRIILRQPLKLSLAFYDTTVCDTSPLLLPLNFSGGDSANHQWKAFNISPSKTWKLLKSGVSKPNDTLAFIPNISETVSQKLAVVLTDNCTNKSDTAYLDIQLLKPSKFVKKIKDTLVCVGTIIKRKAKELYPSKDYLWQWKDITKNKILSDSASLIFTANSSTQILLTITNGCTIDSNLFNVFVNPPLKAEILSGKSILKDTVLCYGQRLDLKSTSKGGLGFGYLREWYIEGNKVSTKDTITINSTSLFPATGGTKNIRFVLMDNCTLKADTFSKNITVVEAPVADFSNGTSCSRTLTDFKFTGKKTSSANSFNWDFDGEGNSTSENPSKLLRIAGNRNISLTVTSLNGCKNKITKVIEVKVQSKADFITNGKCDNDSILFTNLSIDATGYLWYFGDGIGSNLKSVKHQYSKVQDFKTYTVKLVANVKNGCSDSLTKTITILESPKALFTADANCNRSISKFTFTGTQPQTPVTTSIAWNFNNESISTLNNPAIQFLRPGTKLINLLVKSSNGCSDSIQQTIDIKPKSIADFTSNDVCENDSIQFINLSQDATRYNWKFGDGKSSNFASPKYFYSINGQSTTFNVTLVAIVDPGCSDSITKAVTVNANPISSFNATQTGNKLELKATQPNNTKYHWKFGSSDSITTLDPSYTFTLTKPNQNRVCLTVINAAGCSSQTCKDLTLAISIVNQAKNIKLYPNPNQGNFSIDIPEQIGELHLEILNQIGQTIYQTELKEGGNLLDLNLANGIYLMRISNGTLILNQRMVVSK
jgi:PKD repeat protein